jgi:hypothetical protein
MSYARPLNADELGEYGETAFNAICAKAGFIVNKAMRDRAGWDFRVEVPNTALETLIPADKRTIPAPLLFQVKTMWDGGRGFSAPLVSLERLAKSLEPSFVVVLCIGDNREVRCAFLIHMGDEVLASVLKRLTRESQKGAVTNRQKLRLVRDKNWIPVPLSAEEIVGAAREIHMRYAGEASYAAAKREQLRKAGYGPHPFKINMTVQADSTRELVEASLGLKSIRVTNLSATEERFGIKRPFDPPMGLTGIIKVTPTKGHDCKLLFKKDRFADPLVRAGMIFVPAIRPAEFSEMQFLVKSEPLAFHLFMAGTFNLAVPDLDEEMKSIGWWKEIYTVFDILSSGTGVIDIYSADRTKLFSAENINSSFSSADQKRIEYSKKVIDSAEIILKRVGLADIELKFDDILDSHEEILTCLHLTMEVGTTFSFNLDAAAPALSIPFDDPETGVFIQRLQIGPVSVYYCAYVDMTFRRAEGEAAFLEGVVTKSGVVEPADGMSIDTFANTCAAEVGAKCRIMLPS